MISVNSLELISLEFFTGNPQSVRGLGNILLDKKELDMLEYYSQVAETEDIVNETSMKVFSMSYLDDSEDDLALPYDVNSFLLGAVSTVTITNNKLDVNKYESSDLEVVTLRRLKHALSGKVKDITYENNVLRVVTFERSDLTGLQTKAAIVSLLTNVVSDVRVVGNELVVDRWSAADVANGITRMEFEPHISVSATNPYLMSGETTDLVVSLVDGSGSPVDGETVTLTDGTSLYNGITNSQGIYTLYNVEVSSDTTFTATYGTVTASCTVEYCIFADYNDPNNYILRDNTTSDCSLENGVIKIANTSNGNSSCFFTLDHNAITGNFKVVYELQTSSTVTLYQRIGTTRTGSNATVNGDVNHTTFKTVEWILQDGTMTVKIDGTTWKTTTYSSGTYYPIFAFYFNVGEYVYIRNLRIKAL